MPIMLNTIFQANNLKIEEIRLLRHQDNRSKNGCTPYELWRHDTSSFDQYQMIQPIGYKNKLDAPFWASFVGTPNNETLFIGIYSVGNPKVLEIDTPMPHMDGTNKAGCCIVYDLKLEKLLYDLIGKMYIEWGKGSLAWIQRANRQNKQIIELRTGFNEPVFPGFLNFIEPLSRIDKLPETWEIALKNSKGIYLLTCPETKEQYVGSATGQEGFWGRWQEYVRNGHGGDVALKNRNHSNYQVSILEVSSSASSTDEILTREELWKKKLQSRDMGLNRN